MEPEEVITIVLTNPDGSVWDGREDYEVNVYAQGKLLHPEDGTPDYTKIEHALLGALQQVRREMPEPV